MPTHPSPPCVLEQWSSSEVEPSIRLAYWREVAHNWVDVQPLAPGKELDAEWTLLRSNTCLFGTKRSSAYEMRTGSHHVPQQEDMVVISLLQAGEMQLNSAPGENQHVTLGMLGMYNPRQEGQYRWSQNARQTYVALPRHVVQAELGREPGNLILTPQRCALAPMLASQLDHLGRLTRQPGRLDAAEYADLLDATRSLTLLMLRNMEKQRKNRDLPGLEDNLYAGRRAAALRFMEREAHRHDLNVADIARNVDCSRTRLYEAFAAQGASVMDALREIRLQRARRLIEQNQRLHVGHLAWNCGFADQSSFSKAFRLRFGLLPTEWHRQVWAHPRG